MQKVVGAKHVKEMVLLHMKCISPDVYIQCDECKGTRYNRETLEIKFKDKSITVY